MLIETPWPAVMVVICVTAFRLAGPRVAIFTGAALAYPAFMGLWDMSMITVALIGTGAALCVVIGIPLGRWFGKSRHAYAVAEPVLDFMQTMPAFVYLIPIIAFFGTGKPPGILATIIFAMPPVIRLTALGMRGVPRGAPETPGRRLPEPEAPRAGGPRSTGRPAVTRGSVRPCFRPCPSFHPCPIFRPCPAGRAVMAGWCQVTILIRIAG